MAGLGSYFYHAHDDFWNSWFPRNVGSRRNREGYVRFVGLGYFIQLPCSSVTKYRSESEVELDARDDVQFWIPGPNGPIQIFIAQCKIIDISSLLTQNT
jgi:hypothetical protein